MKPFIITILLVFLYGHTRAQAPQYYMYPPTPADTPKPEAPPFYGLGNVIESFYFLSDFPGMPQQGVITHFYVKIATPVDSGVIIHGYRVRMRLTDSARMDIGQSPHTGFTPLFYDAQFSIPYDMPQGGWLKVALQTPFAYSLSVNGDSDNLLVEISQDSNTLGYPVSLAPWIYYYYTNPPANIMLIHSSFNTARAIGTFKPLIGFDVQPLSAAEVRKGQPGKIWPNPAGERLYADAALQGKPYTLYSISGIRAQTGVTAREGIDIRGLPTGMYFLQIEGEVWRVVKE